MSATLPLSVLRMMPLFATLADGELMALLPSIKQRPYQPREFILHVGEESDGLYVIVSGRVKVLLEDERGGQLIVSSLGPNEFFGEMGLVDGGPRSATVIAQVPCVALYIPAKEVGEYLKRNVEVVTLVLQTVTERLRMTNTKVRDFALLDVYDRVAKTLLDASQDQGGEWVVDAGAEQIALMVGASREMVSRVLKQMIAAGLIFRRRRRLVVLDRQALARSESVHDKGHLIGSRGSARATHTTQNRRRTGANGET